MMRTLFSAFIACCALLALASGDAYAQQAPDAAAANKPKDPVQRLCTNDDLLNHTFKMVDFVETPPRRETNWVRVIKYHYLKFLPNYYYGSIASNYEFKSPKFLNQMIAPKPEEPARYRLNAEGSLQLIFMGRIRYDYRCIAILKAHDEYLPGDLVLTGYTRKMKSKLYKLYRLWY